MISLAATLIALGVAVNLDHVQTTAKHRFDQFLGTLGPEKMRQVCRALAIATGCAG